MKRLLFLCMVLQLGSYANGADKVPDKRNPDQINRPVEDIVIRGKVVNDNGDPITGVNVQAKGFNKTVITDAKGNYMMVVQSETAEIVFSYAGYETQTIKVNRARVLNVKLVPDSRNMDEVVVTALGIKRDQKALGYAVTTVKGEELTEALSNNWMDALSGKVAGLNLLRSNAGPVGGTKIILRGENNLTGENEALIVVDGVVINSGSGRRTGSSAAYGTSSDNMPVDYGSGMDDINPEDIESLTVLKGPSAAALYGSRAANGAIIITTKAGNKKGKGIGITLNSNASFESVNRWPDMQYEYGQGLNGAAHYSYGGTTDDGPSTSGTSSAYGPRFDGQSFYQYDPVTQKIGTQRTPWKAYDNITEFFETGRTLTNTVSIDGGSDRTAARFSVTNVNNTWIMPNTGYKRTTVALSVNSKVTDKLTVSAKVNYGNRNSDNLPGAGYGNQSLMYWFIFWQPNADVNWLKNYWVNGQELKKIAYPFSSFPENPYAISYEFINGNNRHTLNGNAQVNYQFSKTFNAMVRASIDQTSEDRFQNRPYDAGSRLPEGSHRSQDIFSREASVDFMLKYAKKLNKDIDFSATAGGSTLRNQFRMTSLFSDGLTFPGVYNHNNAKYGVKTGQEIQNFETNSFYYLVTGGYKNFLFADITGRWDWWSTLASPQFPDKKVWGFYPSYNASFILSEVVNLPAVFDYVKLRATMSGVGSGVQRPYMTQNYYESPNTLIGGALTNTSNLSNPLINPLRTRSFEVGTDIRMFKSRVSLDVAVYKGNTFNQHLYRIIDAASGARTRLTNIGEVSNSGIEIGLTTKQLVSKKGLNWSTTFTFSMNRNRIEELADSSIVLQQRSIGASQIVGKVGGSLGDMYGIGYRRAPDGQIIYDANTGYALLTEDVVYLGNTIPKGKASVANNFSYKGFRLSFMFDTQWGGVGHSQTNHKMSEQGKLKQTLPGRYSGIIGKGVVQTADGKFVPNTTIATNIDEYYRTHWGSNQGEGNTFPTDFIKFREARVDYTFEKKVITKLGLQKASIGVYGRNLFIWSKWPAFDPEFGTLDGSDIVKGFEIAQFPSTRSIGVNLVVTF
jgi:TonB-linked SusC/RagA family outer membrane protein